MFYSEQVKKKNNPRSFLNLKSDYFEQGLANTVAALHRCVIGIEFPRGQAACSLGSGAAPRWVSNPEAMKAPATPPHI